MPRHGPPDQASRTLDPLLLRIGKLEKKFGDMARTMSSMGTPNRLTAPTLRLPFKLREISASEDGRGPIPVVQANVPSKTEKLVFLVIREHINKLQAGETVEQGIARAMEQVKVLKAEVSEDQASKGIFIGQVDKGLKVYKDSTKNRFQVLRAASVRDGLGRGVNPETSPFMTFPFPALQVREDGGSEEANKYFVLGEAITARPSAPSAAKIICNQPNTETAATDAIVTFEVEASENNNGSASDLSFEAVGADEVIVILKPVNAGGAESATGQNDNRIVIPVPITEPEKTKVLVSHTLTLGKEFKWIRNILKSSSGDREKNADNEVKFFAGGSQDLTRLVVAYLGQGATGIGVSDDGRLKLVATQIDNGHTLLELFLTQPEAGANTCLPDTQPAIFKRVRHLKEKRGQPGVFRRMDKDTVLDEEGIFTPGEKIFSYEAKHAANRTDLKFRAEVVGVGKNPQKITVDVVGTSKLAALPSSPSLNPAFFMTEPDGDTEEGDAFADFTVQCLVGGVPQTFDSQGVDTILIGIRKVRAADDPADTLDDPDDNRIEKIPFPIEEDEINQTQKICRVRKLKLGRQFEWRRNFLVRSGVNTRSTGPGVKFRAGKTVLNPNNIGMDLVAFPKNKRFIRLRLRITQTNPPVNLKNCEIHQDLKDGQGFQEVAQKNLKDKAAFQTGNSVNDIFFNVQAEPDREAEYFAIVRAVGGLTKQFPPGAPFVKVNPGGDAPGFTGQIVPSIPRAGLDPAGDLVVNQLDPESDPTMPGVETVWRIWASEARAGAVPGGTGPGGSLSFADVRGTFAEVIATPANDVQGKKKISGNVTIEDPNTNSVDIALSGLVFGKMYAIRRNVLTNGGGVAKQSNTVWFRAGGDINLTGVGLVITLIDTLDPRHTDITVLVSQPGNRIVFFKNLQIEKRQSPQGGPSPGALGLPYKPIDNGRILLRDDETLYATNNSSKPFNFTVAHKRNHQVQVRVTLKGVKGATGGNNGDAIVIESPLFNTGDDTMQMDTGAPFWQAVSSTAKTKWKGTDKGGTLRCKTQLPDKNANTLYTGRALIFISTNTFDVSGRKQYIWNPDLDNSPPFSPNFQRVFFNPPPTLSLTDLFYKDIGTQPLALWNPDRPVTQNGSIVQGDLPPEIYADLSQPPGSLSPGGTLTVYMWFINRFNADPNLSFARTSDFINWPF